LSLTSDTARLCDGISTGSGPTQKRPAGVGSS
jgi:hypothetical protein